MKSLERFGKNKTVVRNNTRKCSTIFQDLDGCLVVHKYDHFENDVISVFPQAIKKLLQMRERGFYIILTTGRIKEECKWIIQLLKEKYNFEFDDYLFNLPTGKRILINDFTNEYKATAYNTKRNMGMLDIDVSSF